MNIVKDKCVKCSFIGHPKHFTWKVGQWVCKTCAPLEYQTKEQFKKENKDTIHEVYCRFEELKTKEYVNKQIIAQKLDLDLIV